ncbi:hypothetical protein POJ06DRAFT_247092 [Lipomyces tetrasporus]|uniref:Uncharacterized protein n=1 Tax=Lipomyces tetrasporus TaxID=54092 RepID=A0AAD7QYC8_9ASCO|nr:uncharacterized protein POJ06DRAFT_247092 [Lipomyces tetrasporus]KAJ8103281.1 hypothetical protein POJ06DRAFT_247092 [Lipomyces tetrasporus]
MGVCFSCTRREEDSLFQAERTGLLSEYAATTMNLPTESVDANTGMQREEAMARIVAMTEENLIDIFAVGAPDRRVNGQASVNYKSLLKSIQVPDAFDRDKSPKVLSSSNLKAEELSLLLALGRASRDYVESLYSVKTVGPLVVMMED